MRHHVIRFSQFLQINKMGEFTEPTPGVDPNRRDENPFERPLGDTPPTEFVPEPMIGVPAPHVDLPEPFPHDTTN